MVNLVQVFSIIFLICEILENLKKYEFPIAISIKSRLENKINKFPFAKGFRGNFLSNVIKYESNSKRKTINSVKPMFLLVYGH